MHLLKFGDKVSKIFLQRGKLSKKNVIAFNHLQPLFEQFNSFNRYVDLLFKYIYIARTTPTFRKPQKINRHFNYFIYGCLRLA